MTYQICPDNGIRICPFNLFITLCIANGGPFRSMSGSDRKRMVRYSTRQSAGYLSLAVIIE